MAKPITLTQNEKDTIINGLSLLIARNSRMAEDKKSPTEVRAIYLKAGQEAGLLAQKIDRDA